MRVEALDPGHDWLRVVDPAWPDPLDASYAPMVGARWTPVGGPDTLYFNVDEATARANVRRLLAGYSVAPEDLDDDRGFALVTARLPSGQRAADAHTPLGLAAMGLPVTYPLGADGREVGHEVCRPLGQAAFDAGLDGVRCRSAATPDGAGRELGWFPRGRARPRRRGSQRFADWYY
ncbi:MAG: RES family NAD+ phosphorylase [Acidimicrobiales bacterium]